MNTIARIRSEVSEAGAELRQLSDRQVAFGVVGGFALGLLLLI